MVASELVRVLLLEAVLKMTVDGGDETEGNGSSNLPTLANGTFSCAFEQLSRLAIFIECNLTLLLRLFM